MNQEAQIEALQHVVAVMAKYLEMQGTSKRALFAAAEASIMGSNGPGTTQKTEAMEALQHLKFIAD